MSSRRRADRPLAARAIVAVAAALSTVGLSMAGPAATASAQPQPAAPVDQCTVRDSRLAELSGLAADGQFRYAIADGGRRLQVIVLRKDCTVQRVITAAVDPFDVEDLALAPDGRLWLADIGDNDRQRETIALHVLAKNGTTRLHRLTYPDGPHDAETLLLDRHGTPYVITKELLGASGVYRPAGPLATPGPTPLVLVTRVRFGRTGTPGGPVGAIGSTLVTGGATSADGSVVAVRTYTDAYLFAAPDGDLAAALGREPVRVPLPNEPQGEAVAIEPDGTLLSGSERADAGPQPIRAIARATALMVTASAAPSTAAPSTTTQPQPAAEQPPQQPAEHGWLPGWPVVLLAIIGAVGLVIVISRARRGADSPRASD